MNENNTIEDAVITSQSKLDNITERFSDGGEYKKILAKNRRIQLIAFVLVIILIAISLLSIFTSAYQSELTTLSLTLSAIAIMLLAMDMFGWIGRASKASMDELVGEQAIALTSFFDEFVEQEVRPSIEQKELMKIISGDTSELMVKTAINDKNLKARSIVIGGLWVSRQSKKEGATVIVELAFNRSYSKLLMKEYSVHKKILESSIGDKANGK